MDSVFTQFLRTINPDCLDYIQYGFPEYLIRPDETVVLCKSIKDARTVCNNFRTDDSAVSSKGALSSVHGIDRDEIYPDTDPNKVIEKKLQERNKTKKLVICVRLAGPTFDDLKGNYVNPKKTLSSRYSLEDLRLLSENTQENTITLREVLVCIHGVLIYNNFAVVRDPKLSYERFVKMVRKKKKFIEHRRNLIKMAKLSHSLLSLII